jgi:hypothetical protein
MAVSNYNINKLVKIYVREGVDAFSENPPKPNRVQIWGPVGGGFILDSESSLNIGMEFKNSYGDVMDKLTAGAKKAGGVAGGGLISTIKGAGEAMSGGKFKLMNTNVKTWEGTSPLTIPSSLKLKFYYGIKNEYNCKTEVWDPIKELVKKFAPEKFDDNFVKFGVPTLGQVMADVLTFGTDLGSLFEQNQQESTSTETDKNNNNTNNNNVVSEAFNKVKNVFDNTDDENNTNRSALNDAVKGTYAALEGAYAAVDNTLDKIRQTSRMFEIRIGQLVFSELYIGNVKWEFDYQQVDSNGYPYKGTVELKDISTSKYTTREYLDDVMPG